LIITDRFSENKQYDGFILLLLYTNGSGSSDYYNNNVQTIRSDRFHRVRRTLMLRTTYPGRRGIRDMSSRVIHLETLTLQTAVVHHFWRRVILYTFIELFFSTRSTKRRCQHIYIYIYNNITYIFCWNQTPRWLTTRLNEFLYCDDDHDTNNNNNNTDIDATLII